MRTDRTRSNTIGSYAHEYKCKMQMESMFDVLLEVEVCCGLAFFEIFPTYLCSRCMFPGLVRFFVVRDGSNVDSGRKGKHDCWISLRQYSTNTKYNNNKRQA